MICTPSRNSKCAGGGKNRTHDVSWRDGGVTRATPRHREARLLLALQQAYNIVRLAELRAQLLRPRFCRFDVQCGAARCP